MNGFFRKKKRKEKETQGSSTQPDWLHLGQWIAGAVSIDKKISRLDVELAKYKY